MNSPEDPLRRGARARSSCHFPAQHMARGRARRGERPRACKGQVRLLLIPLARLPLKGSAPGIRVKVTRPPPTSLHEPEGAGQPSFLILALIQIQVEMRCLCNGALSVQQGCLPVGPYVSKTAKSSGGVQPPYSQCVTRNRERRLARRAPPSPALAGTGLRMEGGSLFA